MVCLLEPVIRGAIGESVIYVTRPVAIAWLDLPAPLLAGIEYLAETLTDTSGAGRAMIITKILLNRHVRVGPYVNRRNAVVNAMP